MMRPRVLTWAAAVAALSALAVLAAAAAGDDGGAGTDHMSPMPFLMNVRYGRSPSDRGARHLEPRADRFFMGTRYGKRSHTAAREREWEGQGEREREALVCEYTGVMTLYQCYRTHNHQREEEPSVGERR